MSCKAGEDIEYWEKVEASNIFPRRNTQLAITLVGYAVHCLLFTERIMINIAPSTVLVRKGGFMDSQKVSTLIRWINRKKGLLDYHISEYQLFDEAYKYFFKTVNRKMIDAHIERYALKGTVPPFVSKYIVQFIYPTMVIG